MPALILVPPAQKDDGLDPRMVRINAYMKQSCVDAPIKSVYNQIRFLNVVQTNKTKDADSIQDRWALIQNVLAYLAMLTPRIFMRMFPPEKTYDGARYESKDYFTTMAAVEAHGMDVPLGEKAFEFLWDYQNAQISLFMVHLLGTMSDLRQLQGQKGLMEEWLETQGVPTYTMGTDAYGREVMVNNQTGEATPIMKPKPRKPRWWKLIKGGV